MVISKRDATTSRFETCHLHDIMREVCLQKAEEENFVETIDSSTVTSSSNSQSPCNSRRLLMRLSSTTILMEEYIKNPKLRSLLLITKEIFSYRLMWMASGFTRLQLMRVLDLSEVKFEAGKLPSDIGKLIHLRYLSLYMAKVTHIPSSMGNLRKLLYLNIHVDSRSPIYIPNLLKEMRELRYLSLPFASDMHDKTKLELGNQVNLERLVNFSTEHCSVKDLQRMTKLRSLSILVRGEGYTTETLSASVSEMRYLEDLNINSLRYDDAERFVLKCIHLQELFLDIYICQRYLMSIICLLTLQRFTYGGLEEDPMPILEKLPQLKEVKLFPRSFSGKRMVCSGGGFPQLNRLEFAGLEEWEEWIIEEGSMSLLHTLEIWTCPRLEELPDGLRFIYSLKHLSVDKEREERLLEGGEDCYKVQHIPFVKFR